MTRPDLFRWLTAVFAIALAPPLVVMGQSRQSAPPVPVTTLNYISLSASYCSFTVKWYQKVFGMAMVYHQNSEVPGGVYILRIGAGPSYIALTQKVPADPSNPTTTIEMASRRPDHPILRVRDRPSPPHFGFFIKKKK